MVAPRTSLWPGWMEEKLLYLGKLRQISRQVGAQWPKAVHSKLLIQTGNTSEARQGGRL